MSVTSLEALRHELEEGRRQTLSFNRTLDHIGYPPEKLDWANLRALHERDADAAELLYGIERGHITPANVIDYRDEATAIHSDAERLRATVRGALPKSFQKGFDLALPTVRTTITLDEIYEDIRAAP